MSPKPLAAVFGLTIGDYLLWNWSLNGHHDVLALISGLTLPPLAIMCVWLLAVVTARGLARITRHRHGLVSIRRKREAGSSRGSSETRRSVAGQGQARTVRGDGQPRRATSPSPAAPAVTSNSSPQTSRKLAA